MPRKKTRKYSTKRKPYRYSSRYSSSRRVGTRKYARKKPAILKIFNSILAVVVISALLLGIIIIISKISSTDNITKSGKMSKKFTLFSSKIQNSENNEIGEVNQEEISGSDFINKSALFRICIISDIHQDLENLKKTGEKIKTSGCDKMFIIGDLTNYGDVESLKNVRDIVNTFGIEYYAIPGDHDIADSLDSDNFNKVFGINYHVMEYEGVRFMLIDNSPNFTEISKTQMTWIQNNVGNVDFIVISQPLFTQGLNPPFDVTYMGSMLNTPQDDDIKEKQQLVKDQGQELLDLIRKNKQIKAIFAGEHHRSSKIEDSERGGLFHYVIGAVTSIVNDLPQSAIQTSRFSVISIYEGKEYSVEDVLID